jgi:hypothetical protein
MLRKMAMLAAVAACALATGAASASAATYVHGGTTTGNLLPSGTGIGSGLRSGTNAVLTTSIGTVTCRAANFAGATTSASGGATVTGRLSTSSAGLAFSTCSDTIPFIDVTSCGQTSGASAGIVATASGSAGGSINLTNVSVTCNLNTGGTCLFTASTANGTYANSDNSATYTSVPVTGSGTFCPSSGTFSAAFAPVTVTSGAFSGRRVILNTTP